MDNIKREEFIEGLTTFTKEQEEDFYNRNKDGRLNPQIDEMIIGYRDYINALGGGFLQFVELYNECLNIAEDNELIGNSKLKARMKDFSSASTNTDTKMLDDMFGMELVTATEFEKEILMLFNILLFSIQNDKRYNKETGYIAYHCTGDFHPKEFDDLKKKIIEIVEETKTKEYKKTRNSDSKTKSTSNLVNVFQVLPNYIYNHKTLNEISRVLAKMLEHIRANGISNKNMPIMEFHFLTAEVEQEAIRGTASHSNYKKTNRALIKKSYEDGEIIRGINAPWKLERINGEIRLQDFDTTIIENWPFMKDVIVKAREKGEDEKHLKRVATADVLTAYQYPFLRQYLNDSIIYQDKLKEEMWEMLMTYMKLYKKDMSLKGPELEEAGR